VSPDGIEELLAAEHHAGAGHQELEQAEFGRGERQGGAVQAYLAATAIQFQVCGFQQTCGACLPTELDLDARNELTNEERLHKVIVCAQLQPDNAIRLRGPRRKKNERNVRQFRMLPDALADIEAVRFRQHNIQKDQIGPFTAAQIDGASPGLRTNKDEPFLLQVVFQQRVEIGVVFNQGYFSHRLTVLKQSRGQRNRSGITTMLLGC